MIALAALLAFAEPPGDVSLVFGGDVAFGRVVAGEIATIGGDAPLAGIAPLLAGADLAVVNLECALFDGIPPTGRPGEIRHIARTSEADALALAGVDLVSLANNHTLDAGLPGLATTADALARRNIEVVGARFDAGGPSVHEQVVVRAVRGLRVAFIAATDRLSPNAAPEDLAHVAFTPSRRWPTALPGRVRAIASSGTADVIIVLVHWGVELVPTPSRAQRALARALIDAGARVVVGHHAHVVQEVERHADGVVFYSLGNLLFDMSDPRTRTGALAHVRLDASGHLRQVELIPTAAGDDDAPIRADRSPASDTHTPSHAARPR